MYLCKMVTNPKDRFSLDMAHNIVQTHTPQKEIVKDILIFVLFQSEIRQQIITKVSRIISIN